MENDLNGIQRIIQFIQTPYYLEITIWKGYLVSFLSLAWFISTSPIFIFKLLQTSTTSLEKSSLLKKKILLLIVAGSFGLGYLVNFSYLYHKIRGQSVVKLYVIYNVFEVAEKLCSSFGSDIIGYFCFSSLGDRKVTSSPSYGSFAGSELACFVLAFCYITIHSVVLAHQWLALHVAVNSFNNGLLTLLISSQFIEVKSSVFKRWDANSKQHQQLIWSDSVERVHLSIFLLLIWIKNIIEGAKNEQLCQGCADCSIWKSIIFVGGSEILVDWIKHSFIVKLNNIHPSNIADYSKNILFFDSRERIFECCFKQVGFSIMPMICLIFSAIFSFSGVVGLIVLWIFSLIVNCLFKVFHP